MCVCVRGGVVVVVGVSKYEHAIQVAILCITRSLAEIFWNNECKHETLKSGKLVVELFYFQMYVFEAIHIIVLPKISLIFHKS